MKHVTVYFDGACTFNPGDLWGWAFIVETPKKMIAAYGRGHGTGTNNVAEQLALWKALISLLASNVKHVRIYGDSNMIVSQANRKWKCKAPHLKKGHQAIRELAEQFTTISFEWKPREQNTIADYYSKKALTLKQGQQTSEVIDPLFAKKLLLN